MRINMFAAWHKEKPDIENIRGLNLAMVKLMTVQVTNDPATTRAREQRNVHY
jgi:hypothetical protein